MQFINAIPSPCNRWDSGQNKELRTKATKKTCLLEYVCETSGEGVTKHSDITHDLFTRENEEGQKSYGQSDYDAHLHTGDSQK